MHSIAILVALAIPSLIANSSASEAVVLLAEALKDDICWPRFQIYAAETACIHLEDITLALVTTIKVEEEEKASRQR